MILAIGYTCLGLFAVAVDAFEAFRGTSDDPAWETRWRSLDPAERTWLAAMATSRNWLATLTDPDEIKLAKGARRDEARCRLHFDLALLPVLVAVTAVVPAGILSSTSILTIVFPGYVAVRGLWFYRRDQQIKGALEDQRKLAAAPGA